MYKDIIDQQIDRSLKFLFNIYSKLSDNNIKKAINNFEIDYSEYDELPSDNFAFVELRKFPINNMENVILSKLYFDFQKDKIPEDIRQIIEEAIDTKLELFDIPKDIFVYKVEKVEKTAASKPVYTLIPSLNKFKVRDIEGLKKSAEVFEDNKHKLLMSHKIEFSENFIKVAEKLGLSEIPLTVKCYIGILGNDLEKTAELISIRASLVDDKEGKDIFYKMAESVKTLLKGKLILPEQMYKLAEKLYDLDRKYQIDLKYYGKLPDAVETVFNKHAEIQQPAEDSEEAIRSMSKADIVGKYGEDILDEIENEDGSIDYDKLIKIVRKAKII